MDTGAGAGAGAGAGSGAKSGADDRLARLSRDSGEDSEAAEFDGSHGTIPFATPPPGGRDDAGETLNAVEAEYRRRYIEDGHAVKMKRSDETWEAALTRMSGRRAAWGERVLAAGTTARTPLDPAALRDLYSRTGGVELTKDALFYLEHGAPPSLALFEALPTDAMLGGHVSTDMVGEFSFPWRTRTPASLFSRDPAQLTADLNDSNRRVRSGAKRYHLTVDTGLRERHLPKFLAGTVSVADDLQLVLAPEEWRGTVVQFSDVIYTLDTSADPKDFISYFSKA